MLFVVCARCVLFFFRVLDVGVVHVCLFVVVCCMLVFLVFCVCL